MLILEAWSRDCSGLIGSLDRRGAYRILWPFFLLLLVLCPQKARVGVFGAFVCGVVGERRGDPSSSPITGRLGACLCRVVCWCCRLLVCCGTIFGMSNRIHVCGRCCDSLLSPRPVYTDLSDDKPSTGQIIAILNACLAPI